MIKTGYNEIDKQINHFDDADLIVIGSRPGMGKTSFALNIINKNQSSCCFISLLDTPEKITEQYALISKTTSQSKPKQESDVSFKNYNDKVYFTHLERPTLIELLEFLIKVNENINCDYFVIDCLTYIDYIDTPLFHKSKKYEYIIRTLKVLCKALNKNIVLVTQIDRAVEVKHRFNFSYYGSREKYIDWLFIVHRWEYYALGKNEIGQKIEPGETLVQIPKSRQRISPNIHLIFDPKTLTFEEMEW